MNGHPAAKWIDHYATPDDNPAPCSVLSENAYLLPATGSALDLACGRGGNALFLARRGLSVFARDIAPHGVRELARRAESEGLPIAAEVADIEQLPWPVQSYDVIVVSRYLHRPLAATIVSCLNPGGLLFYQTFTAAKLAAGGPRNPDYLLLENELIALFSGLRLRFYREDARCGDLAVGCRDEAYFIGQKP